MGKWYAKSSETYDGFESSEIVTLTSVKSLHPPSTFCRHTITFLSKALPPNHVLFISNHSIRFQTVSILSAAYTVKFQFLFKLRTIRQSS